MELYHLHSFLAVVRTGSLSRAALSRNISLPGISKHIKMLEEYFGQPLFTRTPKGMVVNELGRKVQEHAERLEKEVEALNILKKKRPPLRVGVNLSPGFIDLLQLKSDLEQFNINGEVTLINHNTGILLESLGAGKLDACLAFGTVPSQFRKVLTREVHLMLTASSSIPEKSIDLSSHCWIINSDDCPFAQPNQLFWQAYAISPQSTILSQDQSRKDLVAQGLGIGFLEPQDSLDLINRGLGYHVHGHTVAVPLWIAFLEDNALPVVDFLKKVINRRYEVLFGKNLETQPLHQTELPN